MGSYDLGLGLLRQQCLVSIFYTFSHSNAPFAGAEARTRWVTVYGMASAHFFLHPIIFMRYSTCYFYEHSSPDCWSPQERTEDTGRQVGISSLLMKVISSRISNNTQGRLVRLAIPKQKECTEQLYLLVGYCQDGSSRGATPTFPFLPGCGLVELLVCLCPQNMAPLTLLLSWHPEKPQCW